jgi:hypothetical protein
MPLAQCVIAAMTNQFGFRFAVTIENDHENESGRQAIHIRDRQKEHSLLTGTKFFTLMKPGLKLSAFRYTILGILAVVDSPAHEKVMAITSMGHKPVFIEPTM